MRPSVIAGVIAFSLTSSVPHAQSFAAWSVGKTTWGNMLYAGTVNDSGNVFGQYCDIDDGNCVWLLGLNVRCKVGDKYVVLANVASGAASAEIYCFEGSGKGLFQYAFTNLDQVTALVSANPLVGFAFPLHGDQFKVIRFDLNGADAAIRYMRKSAERGRQQGGRTKNTRDTTL